MSMNHRLRTMLTTVPRAITRSNLVHCCLFRLKIQRWKVCSDSEVGLGSFFNSLVGL